MGTSSDLPRRTAEIASINALRHHLLALHKTLLDTQCRWYEKEHGRLGSGGQILQLVVSDPEFAWLRVMSALIVEIDEKLDDKEHPMTSVDVGRFRDLVRGVVAGRAGGDDYQLAYDRALQESPDAVIAQSKVVRGLSA